MEGEGRRRRLGSFGPGELDDGLGCATIRQIHSFDYAPMM